MSQVPLEATSAQTVKPHIVQVEWTSHFHESGCQVMVQKSKERPESLVMAVWPACAGPDVLLVNSHLCLEQGSFIKDQGHSSR